VHEQQKWIAQWREQNALSAHDVPMALRLAGIPPFRQQWRLWIERLLLWFGVAALLTGLIFFVAANWSGIGRFGKFALVEAVIVISLAVYALGARWRHSSAALLAASLAVGALLALIGQTYQTGANTYELFLAWALLIAVWVLIARLPALWALWFVIVHVAYFFYMQTAGKSPATFQRHMIGMIVFDACALAAWEWLAAGGARAWMHGRWVQRLLALTAAGTATILAILVIGGGSRDANGISIIVYLFVWAALFAAYRYRVRDLFMLTGCALSMRAVLTTLLTRMMRWSWDAGSFLVLGLLLMLATAGGAAWLRSVAREWKETPSDEALQAKEVA
jgi:uncharacterized membrane protein